MIKKLLFLTVFVWGCASSQTYTTHYAFPVWGYRDTVKSGSKTDTTLVISTPTRNYINLLATRMDAFLYRYFGQRSDTLYINHITGDSGTFDGLWNHILNPSGNLTLSMRARRSVFNWTDYNNHGSGAAFTLSSTNAGETSNGDPLFEVKTDSASDYMSAVRFLVGGSGVQLYPTGEWGRIGNGHNNADEFDGHATIAIANGGTNATSFTVGKKIGYNGTSLVSLGEDTTRQIHNPVVVWKQWSAVDSQFVWEAQDICTIDSIVIFYVGSATVTVNGDRDHGGTFAPLLSSNYTATTSRVTAPGLQNNGLSKHDAVWIKLLSATAPIDLYVQVNWH